MQNAKEGENSLGAPAYTPPIAAPARSLWSCWGVTSPRAGNTSDNSIAERVSMSLIWAGSDEGVGFGRQGKK